MGILKGSLFIEFCHLFVSNIWVGKACTFYDRRWSSHLAFFSFPGLLMLEL